LPKVIHLFEYLFFSHFPLFILDFDLPKVKQLQKALTFFEKYFIKMINEKSSIVELEQPDLNFFPNQAIQIKHKPNLVLSDPTFDTFENCLKLYILLLLSFEKEDLLFELLTSLSEKFPNHPTVLLKRNYFMLSDMDN
jgi:hypothetical protein